MYLLVGTRLTQPQYFRFLDQNPHFANGFAAGQIWQKMQDSDADFEMTVHEECWLTIEAMAMHLGWMETIDKLGSGWIRVKMTKPKPREMA